MEIKRTERKVKSCRALSYMNAPLNEKYVSIETEQICQRSFTALVNQNRLPKTQIKKKYNYSQRQIVGFIKIHFEKHTFFYKTYFSFTHEITFKDTTRMEKLLLSCFVYVDVYIHTLYIFVYYDFVVYPSGCLSRVGGHITYDSRQTMYFLNEQNIEMVTGNKKFTFFTDEYLPPSRT